MKIGFIGSGNIGTALAKIWLDSGHEVMLSFTRHPEELKQKAQDMGATSGTPEEAVAFGDVVVLAVMYEILDKALEQAGSLDGKIVIDTNNSLLPPDYTEFAVTGHDSVAEQIARKTKGAKVVKAFNTVGANILASDSRDFNGDTPVMFYCGDDADAKEKVAPLIKDTGFEPVDIGKLQSARYIEPMVGLWRSLVASEDISGEFAFSLVRR